ncbi:DNA/RNA helicase [Mesorhizobium sp.]|uniref:DNA/RNA helicase n=1 Tax=Mesorhizobium sp. TaxID=1871066 RepID=UPI00121DECA0|nr:DNA/RNA helicase [Mesorhizobium sp.]TIL66184.1 MAG: DNA/RNA helicase [Mesorhizobium sp.]
MIEIIGTQGSPEYDAALAIKQAFIQTWPGIDATPAEAGLIRIAANVKLSGHKVSDIDVVVIGYLHGKRYIVPTTSVSDVDGNRILGAKIRVRSFIAAIEVKDHGAAGMQIAAGGVTVRYGNKWKSATDQNEEQRYALLEYFQQVTGGNPWVYRCLILRGIDTLPKFRGRVHPAAGAVAGPFSATALLVAMAAVNGIPKLGDEYVIRSANAETMDLVVEDGLLTPLIPTSLDRKKMDRIAARPAEAQELASLLGVNRVHLRGHGGTGKTVLLLQAAYEAYLRQGKRCLLLTYNTALAADIQRTLALMNIPADGEGGGLAVRTSMSFMYAWLRRLGVLEDDGVDLANYEQKCRQALEYFEKEALDPAEIETIKSTDFLQFDFDAILIDEAQDWPQAEADLICRLYGGSAVSLADGVSQLVRGSPTNWKSSVSGQSKVGQRHLQSGLRMKANLCAFANALAEEVGLPWRVDVNREGPGGRIVLVQESYANLGELQKEVLASALNAGNMPVDLLHCVPPSGVIHDGERRVSRLGQKFVAQGWKVWDAVDERTRRQFPRSAEELRIVQYESCRGLEGWTTVLEGLDEFWELKRSQASQNQSMGAGSESGASSEAIAWRWCMIPLTRPIDTVVISCAPNSVVGVAIGSIRRSLGDVFY